MRVSDREGHTPGGGRTSLSLIQILVSVYFFKRQAELYYSYVGSLLWTKMLKI